MKIITPFVTLLLALLLAQPVHAEQRSPASTPWYRIELVIFTRNTPPGATGETWPQSPGKLDWDSVRAGSYATAPGSSLKLTGAKLALNQAGGLSPVIHTAWQQPVYGRNAARPFYLKSDREITPGTPVVEGMIKISVRRYLHVDLDLLLRRTTAEVATRAGGFQTFRFDEHRRMRSKELHYIDHPLMGMLIEITPLSSPGSQPADDAGNTQEPEENLPTDGTSISE